MIPQHLRTVCPSTPVCSKLIPADPSAQTMICNCNVISHEIVYSEARLVPCRTTGSCRSQLVLPLEGCMSHKESWNTSPPDSRALCHQDTPQTRHGQQYRDSWHCFDLVEASSSVRTIFCDSLLREHQFPYEQPLSDQECRHQKQ